MAPYATMPEKVSPDPMTSEPTSTSSGPYGGELTRVFTDYDQLINVNTNANYRSEHYEIKQRFISLSPLPPQCPQSTLNWKETPSLPPHLAHVRPRP